MPKTVKALGAEVMLTLVRIEPLLMLVLTVNVLVLAPYGVAEGTLPEAAARGSLSEVRALIDSGADIAARDARGYTALMAAVLVNPDIAVAELLLD